MIPYGNHFNSKLFQCFVMNSYRSFEIDHQIVQALFSLSAPSPPLSTGYLRINPHWNCDFPLFLHLLRGERWQRYFKCPQKFQCRDAVLCHETTPLCNQSGTANALKTKTDTTPCASSCQTLSHSSFAR